MLLEQAEDFEDALDVEHVEDILINKRIVLDDEQYQLYHEFRRNNCVPHLNAMPLSQGDGQWLLAPHLRKISQYNRHRRNFLLLRDW